MPDGEQLPAAPPAPPADPPKAEPAPAPAPDPAGELKAEINACSLFIKHRIPSTRKGSYTCEVFGRQNMNSKSRGGSVRLA